VGRSPREISADWAAQRISLLNLWDVLLLLFKIKKEQPKTYAARFHYPPGGIGRIYERLAERAEGAGAEVRLGARATEIRRRDGAGTRVSYLREGREESEVADFVISTAPLPRLLEMLPEAPAEAADAAARMSFRGLRFLNLIVNRPVITDNTWIYISEPEYFFFRVQDLRNWSPSLCPPGKCAVELEIACDAGDEKWRMPDDEVKDICMRDLAAVELDIAGDVEAYASSFDEYSYPIYDIDYKEKLKAVLDFVWPRENLLTIGRGGLFRYNNMDHSIKMGLLAARYIAGGEGRDNILEIAKEQSVFEAPHKKH